MSKHGVRYVIVEVHADHVEDFAKDVEAGLSEAKRSVPFSSALFPTFKDVKVHRVLMGYQGQRVLRHCDEYDAHFEDFERSAEKEES